MKKQPLRVGFDLDGVILYNPARIIRPLIAIAKKIFLKKKELKFYYPKTNWEKFMWYLFHKSSIFVASGFDEIKEMAKKDQIEAYVITGRYSFLKKDFEKWIQKAGIQNVFRGHYYNKNDEQPHLFKEKMIKKLKLDLFVEDNWDIVKHLKDKLNQTKTIWIYNIFDRGINYKDKLPHLRRVAEELKKKYL